MPKIYSSILDTIGHTPLVDISHLIDDNFNQVRLLAKIESFNPGGSIKDRAALNMLHQLEARGEINRQNTIIEPTSGNTGVALAMIAAVKGYKLQIIMPETMSKERQLLMKAYGAEVILTEGKKGMQGAINKAQELYQTTPNAILLRQFENPDNPKAHITTTASEIWQDTDGKVDVLVAGVGTGGTISGTAAGLKQYNKDIIIVGIEPAQSAVLSGQTASSHKIQGIGAGFIPKNYEPQLVDLLLSVSDEDAYHYTQKLAAKAGILAGISSGAALSGAVQLVKAPQYKHKTIVVILPDTGERYLSGEVFR